MTLNTLQSINNNCWGIQATTAPHFIIIASSNTQHAYGLYSKFNGHHIVNIKDLTALICVGETPAKSLLKSLSTANTGIAMSLILFLFVGASKFFAWLANSFESLSLYLLTCNVKGDFFHKICQIHGGRLAEPGSDERHNENVHSSADFMCKMLFANSQSNHSRWRSTVSALTLLLESQWKHIDLSLCLSHLCLTWGPSMEENHLLLRFSSHLEV